MCWQFFCCSINGGQASDMLEVCFSSRTTVCSSCLTHTVFLSVRTAAGGQAESPSIDVQGQTAGLVGKNSQLNRQTDRGSTD